MERRSLHINQDELARRIGVNRTYISKMERNEAENVGVKIVADLAEALGVSAAYLLGLSDDPLGIDDDELEPKVLRESEAVYVAAGTTERRIMELLPSLSDADKFLILQTVERLANTPTPHIIGNDE